MSNLIRHPYHLVDESPWPLIGALGAFYITSGLVKWFHFYSITLLLTGLFLILIVIFQWWRDISKEGAAQGLHTNIVELGLRWGMILFIVSEVFFFLSFFWAFFHRSLSPTVELGRIWPPSGLNPFNPFQVPLLNTIVLLSSGVSVTWAHHAIIRGNYSSAFQGLALTIILGIYFTCLQAIEYYEASFRIADRVYGSTFFIATGFHGLHVLVGTSFLGVCHWRHNKGHFRPSHHFGFEAAAWYWHFVDVVWLFLFISIYWWGGAFRNNIINIFYLH
jgi:cytochrome c oxidase subunit 3